MANTRTRKPAGTTEAAEATTPAFDFGSLTAVPIAAPPKKANPVAHLAVASKGDDWDAKGLGTWMEIPALPAGQVTPLVNLLHNAAKDAGHGMNTRTTKNDDGTVTVAFQSKRDKREAKYSAEDVKTWAVENYPGYAKGGKLSAEIRKAYRLANGFESADAEQTASV